MVWRYAEESDLIALVHNLLDLVWKKCKKVLFLGMFELFTKSGCSNNQYLISFVGLIFYICINVIDWLINQLVIIVKSYICIFLFSILSN